MSDTNAMNRLKVILGAVLIQLSLGAIYAWSVFTPALKAAGWSKLDTQIVFAVGLVTFAVVMVFARGPNVRLSRWLVSRCVFRGLRWMGRCRASNTGDEP